ncbi:MAG: ABC transporter permease [Elusimicrobiota bacterium]|jgi:ABC-2 type transport system permease protein|nr:ABC transporter permease [Elusimicrobiota bacterium]
MKIKNFTNVFKREIKRIFTHRDLLLICFAAPMVYGLLFSFLYINKRAGNINIGVVDFDNSAISRELIRAVNASPELNPSGGYASPNEAYADILKDKIDALYFIPQGFSEDIKKGKPAVAVGAVNAGNFLVSSAVLKKVSAISMEFSKQEFIKILMRRGFDYKSADNLFHPLRADNRYIFNPEMNYSAFFLPALLIAVLQQILLIAVCSSVSKEKIDGGQKELYEAAGGSWTAVFLGKSLPYVFVGIALNLAGIFIMLPHNGIYASSVLNLTLVSTAFIMAITAFAILISALFNSPQASLAALMFYAMPTLLLSGFAWPNYALPIYLQIISLFFPSTYAVNHIRILILGDAALKYSILPIAVLLSFALLCYFAARLVERKTRRIFAILPKKSNLK